MRRRRPAVGIAIAAHKLIVGRVRARVALLKINDGRHQPKRTVGGVQVERRREMTTIGRVLDDVLAAGVACCAQKKRGPTYELIRLF
eukprot:130458-Pleurochrysis_carterae.AAC.1